MTNEKMEEFKLGDGEFVEKMAEAPVSPAEKDVVYRIKTDDIDRLIDSRLKLLNYDKADATKKVESLQDQMKVQEKKQKEIDLIFSDCMRMIEKFKADIEAEQTAEKIDEPHVILSGSDSDDDVQFIEATYEPLLVASKPTKPASDSPQQPPQLLQQLQQPQPLLPRPLQPVLLQQSPQLMKSPIPCQVVPHSPLLSPRMREPSPVRYLRVQQTREPVNKSLLVSPPGATAQSPSSMVLSMILNEPPLTCKQQSSPGSSQGLPVPQVSMTGSLLQPRGATFTELPPKHIDLAIGMKLYGRKFNDIWYKGTLIDIQNKDRPRMEHKLKVKFDGKGMKILTGKQVACIDVSTEILPVGTRVIEGEETPSNWFFAGIVAEPANVRNNNRYLIFFDDGYAQYCYARDVHQVVEQSANVWEDIHPDSSQFIQDYLSQYPERPMVRLQEKQMVKTEWKGKWWVAHVQRVDASLVQMYFDADKRVEWIYRGSTRLEPLYTELANAEASKVSGKGRRHNIHIKSRQKPFVEYTRGSEEQASKSGEADIKKTGDDPSGQGVDTGTAGEIGTKKRAVARKSISKPAAPVVVHDITDDMEDDLPPEEKEQHQYHQASSVSDITLHRDIASVLQERLDGEVQDVGNCLLAGGDLGEDVLGERMEIEKILPIRDSDKKKYKPHVCCASCLRDVPDDPQKFKCNNPLLIPQLCGWERQITKQSNYGKRVIVYRAPCARRLRTIEEVDKYLAMTNSLMTIDMFCFDSQLHTDTEYVPVRTFCDIKDLSYGKETVPISCVNGIDREYPDYVEYSNQRTPAKGVKLNLDPSFLVGCDCTDGCRDRTKCRCIQLTVDATRCIAENLDAGYHHRRLRESLITGVYECNVNCKCDCRCSSRVAQNGLQLRLQVFKTEKRGWGLRCLDDIPAGGFICIYVGQLLTEQGANEDGQQFGDEYLAELDYIEVVERVKDGFESNVDEDEGIMDDISTDNSVPGDDSDSTYSGEKRYAHQKAKKKNGVNKIVLKREDKAWSVKCGVQEEISGANKTQDWLNSITCSAIVISDEEEDKAASGAKVSVNDDELPDLDEQPLPPVSGKPRVHLAMNVDKEVHLDERGKPMHMPRVGATHDSNSNSSAERGASHDEMKCGIEKTDDGMASLKITEPTSLNIDDVVSEDSDDNMFTEQKDASTAAVPEFKRTTRSQTHSRFSNLPDPKSQKHISPQQSTTVNIPVGNRRKSDFVDTVLSLSPEKRPTISTRPYFGEEFSYVMDAKSMGNLGRYLNHSCTPNVFVQNVFVDTHDLRFPWIAFFAAQYIRAGTELTWDYNYEVGSVPGKVLYCYCGSAECRGRLL
ncbi:Histone-lysine N-methyltransferase SETDB1 [Lamellibrachia satsuma]|nr:Histone-lysine N-methyltransferase SETDB1 [Lamellibrachia satsuma]